MMVLERRNAQSFGQEGPSRPINVPDPESLRLSILRNPNYLAEVREQKPELAATLNDPVRFREAISQMIAENDENGLEAHRQNALLNATLSQDAQKEIEERIRLQQVADNEEEACRHNPECEYFIQEVKRQTREYRSF